MTDSEEALPDEGGDELSPEDQEYFESGGVEAEDGGEAEGEVVEAAPEPEPEPKPEPQKTVPHGAFHEERERRKAAEDRAARIEGRLDQMLRQMAPQEQAPQQEPVDPTADPMGALNHLMEAQKRNEEREAAAAQAARQQQEVQALVSQATADFDAAKAARPELGDAYRVVIDGRTKDLQAMGYAPQEVSALLQREEVGIIATARQRGIPIAQIVESMATQRGWSPAPTQSPEIDSINKANGASRSLSNGGGTAAGTTTAKDIDEMSDEDFAAWMESHPKQARAYLGG